MDRAGGDNHNGRGGLPMLGDVTLKLKYVAIGISRANEIICFALFLSLLPVKVVIASPKYLLHLTYRYNFRPSGLK